MFLFIKSKNVPHLDTETINEELENIGWKDKQSAHQWRSVITTIEMDKSNFSYEVTYRQLGRMGYLNRACGHYDQSTLLDKRRTFMEWWSKTLVEQGLLL